MNRFARYSTYAMVSLVMATLIVASQQLIMLPTVYTSIHQMGDRLGGALPNGYSDLIRSASVESHETVTLVRPPAVPTVFRELNSFEFHPPPRAVNAGIDLRVPLIMVVIYLAVLFLVSTVSLWRHTQTDFRNVRAGSFVGILALGSGVCVLLALLYSGARVFWTGVDQAFYDRSIVQVVGSSTTRIRDDQLLAMGHTELIMLLLAMVLTAIPILFWIDTKLFHRVNDHADELHTRPGPDSLMSRVYEHKLFERHFSERLIKRVGGLCYVLITLFLWTSPWSTTMVRAIWIS